MSVYVIKCCEKPLRLSVLAVSLMGFHKKMDRGWVFELYPHFFFDCWHLFNFAKPLITIQCVCVCVRACVRVVRMYVCTPPSQHNRRTATTFDTLDIPTVCMVDI